MIHLILLFVIGMAAAVFMGWLGMQTLPANPLGALLILAGLGYCLGGAWYLAVEKNGDASQREPGDRSLWLLVPGFAVGFMAPPLEYLLLPETLPHRDWMEALGLASIAIGLGLRLWTRRALGRLYSGRLQVKAQHTLVRSGPYRWVRHPGYLGFLLILLGFSLGYASLIGLLSTALLLLPGLVYRIRTEERLLSEAFGPEFSRYSLGTWRLLPGLW